MKTLRMVRVALAVLLVSLSACATTETTSTVWTDPNAGSAYLPPPPRPGQVQSVQETVRRTEGHPVGGALAGALIGGILTGGHGTSGVVGAAGGAAVGAAVSQGSSESRTYQVVVRFDDGGYGTYVYNSYSPFRPGQRVVLTPQGLLPG